MSGIVGLWNRDSRPADADTLARMTTALAHRGPDGTGRHLAGPFGLACLQLRSTPEQAGETQPLVGASGAVLAMDGRIDNRDELRASLEVPAAASDAACALAAWEAWGDAFAARLVGDFALAVLDAPRQRLVLARDAIGIRPLHYHAGPRCFAFASEIKALLAHPDVPLVPDDDGLADFLLLGSRPLDRLDVTCFAGIAALPPAHLLILTADRLVVRRYWDFDTGRPLRFARFGEYVEGFRAHFSAAVRRRTRATEPVAVSVSGGLDSSSIFCQAQTLRRSGGAVAGVTGISYVGAAGTDADERGYLLDLERHCGVAIARIPIEPLLGVVSGAEDQVRAIEAPFLDYMWGVTRAVQREARERGARVLLSGHWGDQMLFSPAYLVDLLRGLRWGEIAQHTREYRRWLGRDEARAIQRQFLLQAVRRHVPTALVPALKALRRRLFPPPRVGPWYADAFLARALKDANRPATVGEGFHSSQAEAIYRDVRSKYHVHCMEWNNKIAALHGLEAAFPFLDRDLVQFLMAVPGEVQNRGGVPRALLREAMRGVLPEPIRQRSWKADFTAPVNDSVSRDLEHIAGTLTSGCLGVRLGYLDAHRLPTAVRRLGARLTGERAVEAWELTDVFGVETWLRVFLSDAPRWFQSGPGVATHPGAVA